MKQKKEQVYEDIMTITNVFHTFQNLEEMPNVLNREINTQNTWKHPTNIQEILIKFINVKLQCLKFKNYWISLTVYWNILNIQRKRLVILKSQQQKLSKMKHKKSELKKKNVLVNWEQFKHPDIYLINIPKGEMRKKKRK